MYKLNRSTFKAMTAEEASNHSDYYKKLDWKERFKIVMHLNSVAYKFVGELEPRMDRTVFKIKSRN
jgi:hypothetical protein